MSITISGTVTVQDKTGKQHIIDAGDLSFEPVETESRSMGTETTHQASTSIEDEDDSEITISVYEYPEGVKNTVTTDGATYIKDNITIDSN